MLYGVVSFLHQIRSGCTVFITMCDEAKEQVIKKALCR